jgi:urease accessory protein
MKIMRLLQMTDMAFSFGAFVNPDGIETAAEDGSVSDVDSLERFTRAIALQSAYTDGVAALCAYREAMRNNLRGIEEADIQYSMAKNEEVDRIAMQSFGHKMAVFARRHYADNKMITLWCNDIKEKLTPGCLPVALGLVFAAEGMSEESLFGSLMYQVIKGILQEAVKCLKITGMEAQALMCRLTDDADGWYRRVRMMNVEDITAHAQADLFSSMRV